MKGGRKRGCLGREGAVEGRALPRLSLLQLCKNRILPHPAAQIYRVKVNSHEFEDRLKISSHCLTVLDENSMDQHVKYSKYSSVLYACSMCCSKITRRHITDTCLWSCIQSHPCLHRALQCLMCAVFVHWCVYVCVCVCIGGQKQSHCGGATRHTLIEKSDLLQYTRKHYASVSRASMIEQQHQQRTRTFAHQHTHRHTRAHRVIIVCNHTAKG